MRPTRSSRSSRPQAPVRPQVRRDEAADVKFRVVADHVRSALMIMSDGVRPSNVGRGYVLRVCTVMLAQAMRVPGVTDPDDSSCCRLPQRGRSRPSCRA